MLLAFTGAGGAAGLALLFSGVCKNQFVALVLSAAVYLFPVMLPVTESSPFFRLWILQPIYHAQFISLMSAGQVGGRLLYAVWAVPAALFLAIIGAILGKKAFASHKIA